MSITVINGAELVADASGALYWPAQSTLVVADLHLEKESGFAQRHGTLLPPYDSAETLRALAQAIDRYVPARVLCLGDSFHELDRAADATDISNPNHGSVRWLRLHLFDNAGLAHTPFGHQHQALVLQGGPKAVDEVVSPHDVFRRNCPTRICFHGIRPSEITSK